MGRGQRPTSSINSHRVAVDVVVVHGIAPVIIIVDMAAVFVVGILVIVVSIVDCAVQQFVVTFIAVVNSTPKFFTQKAV